MIRVGIVGFGLMGRTHAAAYVQSKKATITAIADPRQEKFDSPVVVGNIDGQGDAQFDPSTVERFDDAQSLIESGTVDAVSICSPTPDHVDQTIAAVGAGLHVLVEKPLGVKSAEAHRAVVATERRPDLIVMPAMCMRFWPGWSWLASAVRERTYGSVLSATFTRLGAMPGWAGFYKDADLSGSAILDLHIHDADFIRFCFGEPESVESVGYSHTTSGIDHVLTRYRFAHGPKLISAEGGWCMVQGYPFTMRYSVNFEQASADFDLARGRSGGHELILAQEGRAEPVSIDRQPGYVHEIMHFLECIEEKSPSSIVTLTDAERSIALIEAERASALKGGERITIARGK